VVGCSIGSREKVPGEREPVTRRGDDDDDDDDDDIVLKYHYPVR
jgi:hypothetical protein